MGGGFLVLALSLALLAGARAAAAQAVGGELVEGESGRPVAGAFVALLDASGKQVEGAFTDAAGRFLLRAPAAGRYTVRAERVGRRASPPPSWSWPPGGRRSSAW